VARNEAKVFLWVSTMERCLPEDRAGRFMAIFVQVHQVTLSQGGRLSQMPENSAEGMTVSRIRRSLCLPGEWGKQFHSDEGQIQPLMSLWGKRSCVTVKSRLVDV